MILRAIRRTVIVRRYRKLNRRIRTIAKYKEWREKVLRKDGYKCVICGSAKRLEVDHIHTFASIVKEYKIKSLKGAIKCRYLWNLKNGRTLCHSCHVKTPTYLKRLG